MCLITAFGISDNFYVDSEGYLFQEFIQGNRAAASSFLLITVILVWALYQRNLIMLAVLPISKVISYLAGQIFIDNTNLNIINKRNEDINQIVERVQSMLTLWHWILEYTGGQLKL